jgi:transcriptional regulator with XRE-family HTH domain
MSPFSQFLHDLRMRRRLRQADLADLLGYEQSYISALEIGLKGPPTNEFLDRLTHVLALSTSERDEMQVASHASQRKLVIDPDAPPDIYWLLADLRGAVDRLSPSQVRIIREVLVMPAVSLEERTEPVRRLKRRKKEEATM